MMGDINFREFYSKCKFYFLMEGNANWDYYLMQSRRTSFLWPSLRVAQATPVSGTSRISAISCGSTASHLT